MKQSLSSWDDRWRSVPFWLAVGLGSGLMRPAPGTWGSLFGLLLGYGLIKAGMNVWLFMSFIITVTLIGNYVIEQIEKASGVHDAPEIVIDEVAGIWIAMLPIFHIANIEALLIAAFVLFRIFDIWKPYPIGWLDRKVSGGFGVMVDDLVAGVYALVCIEGFFFFA